MGATRRTAVRLTVGVARRRQPTSAAVTSPEHPLPTEPAGPPGTGTATTTTATATTAATTRTRNSVAFFGHSIGRNRHRMEKLPLSFGNSSSVVSICHR